MPLIDELQNLWFLDKTVDFTLWKASIFGTHYLFVHSQSYDRNDKLFIQDIAWELRFHFWYLFAKSSNYLVLLTLVLYYYIDIRTNTAYCYIVCDAMSEIRISFMRVIEIGFSFRNIQRSDVEKNDWN